VRLFIDECLSPQLALWLNQTGQHDAVHPLHIGRRGEPDHRVLARCINDDRVIVTENGRDFRRLIGRTELHPGVIILPSLDRKSTWHILQAAIAFLGTQGDPMDVMVNRVLEVGTDGNVSLASISLP
jgi:predicted nuclease of predicted toxin-antitoxin system